ncbi:major facilitator superfamily domain-containing protein [Mycena olivaceomarginata]|nr:major facilitator superfamily domain-containing protein [Mycena olivaceomarginata]
MPPKALNSSEVSDDSDVAKQESEMVDEPRGLEARYMTGLKLILACISFLLSTFLSSLDQSIVSTAIPGIVSRFQSLDEVTWIPGAYFLTQAGLILTAGQLLTVFPPKYVYVCSIAIFEIGSLVCAVSPSMTALIIGRAVAGCGAAAMFTSVSTIDAEIIPLDKRPLLFGSFGVSVTLAIVLGPLLGGVLTDHVSWRWCFYINLPLGIFAILLIFGVLETCQPRTINHEKIFTVRDRLASIDWVGSVICIGMVVSLLLPLQWGGITKSWDDATVIVLFCLSALLLGIFVLWEWRKGDASATFFIGLGLFIGVYYLPLWFQAKGHSATRSGIDILPFMISVVASSGITAGLIAKLGRYWHIITISPLIFSIGSGLLFTLSANSPTNQLIGYQILAGTGLGILILTVYL